MVSAIVAAMKAIFAKEGDEGGKNMAMLVFPANIADGKPIVTTTKRDSITLVLNKTDIYPQTVFTWHTPFDAVVGEITCPKCGQSISKKWSYCPWCGVKEP